MKWRVGCRADTDGEEPPVAEPLADEAEQLVLVAHGAVGQEHHLAQQAGRGFDRPKASVSASRISVPPSARSEFTNERARAERGRIDGHRHGEERPGRAS